MRIGQRVKIIDNRGHARAYYGWVGTVMARVEDGRVVVGGFAGRPEWAFYPRQLREVAAAKLPEEAS